jgi:co-chaperonin GroES (HSP10)
MIQPIKDNVLAKSLPSSKMSEGGIIVPESYSIDSNKMLVIATGNGTNKNPMQFKPGDIVFRVKGDGHLIEFENEKYYLIKSNHLLAKCVSS